MRFGTQCESADLVTNTQQLHVNRLYWLISISWIIGVISFGLVAYTFF